MELLERFWSKVDCSGGPDACWPWTAAFDSWGYGQFRVDGKNVIASKFAFKIENELPPGLNVLHKCDNPPCCNPGHLYAGTHKQNAADMVTRGRHAHGERGGLAKLTDLQVLEARLRFRPKHPVHGCTAMAKEFGVSVQSLHLAITGKQWAHLVGAD
jgi:hypothetical protein